MTTATITASHSIILQTINLSYHGPSGLFFVHLGQNLGPKESSDIWRNSANFHLNSAIFLQKHTSLKLSYDLY